MDKTYSELFLEGCQFYILAEYARALRCFEAARNIEATIYIDLWRARTMMDMNDYFTAMQLLLWLADEHNNDVRVHSMLCRAHVELLTLQPSLQEQPIQ